MTSFRCLHRPLALLVLAAAAAAAHAGPGHAGGHAHAAHAPDAAAPEQQAWGIAGDPRAVRRTIVLEMTDAMRFVPDRIEVREGETVRLRLRNRGRMLHELVLGTPEELRAHAQLMRQHPGMEHDEAHMVHVDPGGRGELVWTFNRPGTFQYACLIPGHYEAGMAGTVRVIPATKEQAR